MAKVWLRIPYLPLIILCMFCILSCAGQNILWNTTYRSTAHRQFCWCYSTLGEVATAIPISSVLYRRFSCTDNQPWTGYSQVSGRIRLKAQSHRANENLIWFLSFVSQRIAEVKVWYVKIRGFRWRSPSLLLPFSISFPHAQLYCTTGWRVVFMVLD